MPELPEVETVARGLRGKALGRTIREVALHHSGFPFPIHLATSLESMANLKRLGKDFY